MGLSAADRPALEAGLAGLKIINAMPPCASGATIEWPDVVFQSPDEAGSAVAVALQDATCTFTVGPTAPPAAGSAVRSIRLKPLDGAIEVTWGAPAPGPDPIVGYRVRCVPAGGDPVDSGDGPALDRKTVVNGLTNGTEYTCEVAADTSTKQGDWTASNESATPSPLPAAPGKPDVTGGNRTVTVEVVAEDAPAVTGYHYECSSDDGKTWPITADVEVGGGSTTSTQIGGLTNGRQYRCRAFAVGPSGQSEASPLSDAVRACSNVLECNGLTLPVVAAIGGILVGALLLALYFLFRGRGGGYVVAVVDTVHSANLGGGSEHRIGVEWAPGGRRVERVVNAKGGKADFRVRKLRGDRFRVRDRDENREVMSGEPIVVVDSTGVHHELVLWAFSGKAASAVSTRR
jgi:hypothetical protein